MNVDDAYRFCRELTHKHGGNFSVGFRFLPKQKRNAVYAAYSFCRFADDIADEPVPPRVIVSEGMARGHCSVNDNPSSAFGTFSPHEGRRGTIDVSRERLPHRDPSPPGSGEKVPKADEGDTPAMPSPSTRLRMTLLQQWQAELDACYRGAPTHTITVALADALQHFTIPKDAFIALIDGCRQDMVKTRYETFAELLHYCELVASSISDISLAIFGYRSPAALPLGRNLSTALQLTNVTRDVGDDLARDRVYLPQEELRTFGVSERDLFDRVENDRVRQLIEFQIARAERYFRDAEPLLDELAFDARFPTLLMGGVYATVLSKLRKDPLMVVRMRLSLTPLQKILVIGTRMLRPHFV